MNIALVTASGTGSRMNMEIPKQFLTVNDKPIVIYTLETLQNNPSIDYIIVACLAGWEKLLESNVQHYHLDKVKWIVPGGETGQESITHCLDKLRSHVSQNDLILVHDGNRPFVRDYIINESIRICKAKGGAVAAIPVVEAILELNKKIDGSSYDNCSTKFLDRDALVRTQTPHTFPFSKLDDAYRRIKLKGNSAVAPCTVMVELGETVYLSPGSELNFKITTQDDLKIFEAILRAEKSNY